MTATPETREELQALVGPGQQDVFDQFLEEVQQQQAAIDAAEQQGTDEAEKLLAGKFKSTEDLEKAYLEAQKLISSRGQQQPEPETPAKLTREQAAEHYGDFIASAADEEGIDLAAWDSAVRQGQDTKELRDKLAAKTGIPVQLIEQYEQAYRPQQAAAADAPANGLTDADVTELKALVGGEQEFERLSQWAVANMGADELADYNAAVDSGNKAAVRLALRAMQSRAAGGKEQGEPELIGGGKPTMAEVFETQQQAIEAMRKTNSKGQRLYNVDAKYKAWYEKTLARSTFA
jgi:hypothetical protein